MSCALVPTHDDDRFGGHVDGAAKAARMNDLALEVVLSREGGNVGDSADADRHYDVGRVHGADTAIRHRQTSVPSLRRFIIFAAKEGRPVPDVKLHRLGVKLEPTSEFVLRNKRPTGRKGKIWQMIAADLVVQREGVIARAPIIAYPFSALDNKRIHVQVPEARGNRQSWMPAPITRPVAGFIGLSATAPVEPVGA